MYDGNPLEEYLNKIKTVKRAQSSKLSWAFLTNGHNYDPGIRKLTNVKTAESNFTSFSRNRSSSFSKLSKKSSKNINPYRYAGDTKPVINATTVSPMPWKVEFFFFFWFECFIKTVCFENMYIF